MVITDYIALKGDMGLVVKTFYTALEELSCMPADDNSNARIH